MIRKRKIIETDRRIQKYDVECVVCGEMFKTSYTNALYCKSTCRNITKKESHQIG